MDLQEIATKVLFYLGFYLTKTGEGASKKFGEKIADNLEGLLSTIKGKFKKDHYAEQTLNRLVEQPESKGRQLALETVLVEYMEADRSFIKQLNSELQKMKNIKSLTTIISHGNRSVVIGGDATKNIIVTGDNN